MLIGLTGGTGFVGRAVTRALLQRGHRLRVLVRRSSAFSSLPVGAEPVFGDVTVPDSLGRWAAGCEAVVHLVAVIREIPNRGVSFERVNAEGARNVAAAARAAGVSRFVHVSALGVADDPRYPYRLTKWRGEEAVRTSGIPHSVIRPSVIFGAGDEFMNTLARLVHRAPVVPVVGDGRTRFQPVWVEDVARCAAEALDRAAPGGFSADIGGPDHWTYEGMIDLLIRHLGVRRAKIHVPIPLMMAPAALMEAVLPRPPVTRQQLKMLAFDNTTALDAIPRQFGFAARPLADGIREYIR